MMKVTVEKDESARPCWLTLITGCVACTLLLVGIGCGVVVPILSWVSAMTNLDFNGVNAQEISKVVGSPCEGFYKIDWVWPCVLGIAIVGTISLVLNCGMFCHQLSAFKNMSEDGESDGPTKGFGTIVCCANIAIFVKLAMIFDVWVTTPELCKDAMAVSFNDGIPLWTMVEVLSVYFIISLCMLSCFCCCACAMMACGGMALAALGKEMTQEDMQMDGGMGAMQATSSVRMAMAAFAQELGLSKSDMKTVMSGGQVTIDISG